MDSVALLVFQETSSEGGTCLVLFTFSPDTVQGEHAPSPFPARLCRAAAPFCRSLQSGHDSAMNGDVQTKCEMLATTCKERRVNCLMAEIRNQ